MNDSRPRRGLAFRAVYLAVAALAVFSFVEGAIRWVGLAPGLPDQYGSFMEDPHLPYRPIPGSTLSGTSTEGEFEYEYVHNSQGFRDVEHALAKPDGVFRILAVGDSFTYGGAVPFEETFLRRLERELNSRPGEHPRVEIIKAGIPRFFPEPERILVERYGLDYSPDLILVGFLPNDVIDTYLGMESVTVADSGFLTTRQAAALGATGTFLYEHCHACRIVLSRYVSRRMQSRYTPNWDEVFVPDGFHEADWRKVEGEYRKIVELAAARGTPTVILHIPQVGPWEDRHAYPGQRLERFSDLHGVEFVDAFPALREAGTSDELYYPEDGHCRAEGYEVIAQVLYERLTESELVP